MSAASRRKGQVAEREAVAWLVERLGPGMVERRRGSDQAAEGGFDLWIRCHPPIAVEVKRQERAEVGKWLDQATRNAPPGWGAAVMWRASRRGWCFVLAGEDFMGLVREVVR